MICPECQSRFDESGDSTHPVHHCPSCRGTWIGGRSLHAMVEQYSDSASIEQVLNSILDLDFRSSRRQCPKCTPRHLKVVTIEDTELDFCSRCKGLFFDPGELQQVLPGIASANAHPGNANRSDRQEGFWSSLLRMLDNG